MSSSTTLRFCPGCGAACSPDARFCGGCGAMLGTAPPPLAPAKSTTRKAISPPIPAATTTVPTAWKVAFGDALPPAGKLFPEQVKPARSKKPRAAGSIMEAPLPRAKSVWGSTFFMALTQGADMVTRAMEGGAENDRTVHLRLGIAAAVAVFGLGLGFSPRLRTVLVRLGTVALALLQGSSILSVLQGVITDPQLIQSVMPNVGAQLVSLLAVVRLFREVGKN